MWIPLSSRDVWDLSKYMQVTCSRIASSYHLLFASDIWSCTRFIRTWIYYIQDAFRVTYILFVSWCFFQIFYKRPLPDTWSPTYTKTLWCLKSHTFSQVSVLDHEHPWRSHHDGSRRDAYVAVVTGHVGVGDWNPVSRSGWGYLKPNGLTSGMLILLTGTSIPSYFFFGLMFYL